MLDHVAIRREAWVAGTRQRPEIGVFTQTHSLRPPVPTGRIARGELVWMKWSGGPVVGVAEVRGFREFPNCTASELRTATSGFSLHDLDAYWFRLPPKFHGLAVYLGNERWLDEPLFPRRLSHGASWVVIESGAAGGWPTSPGGASQSRWEGASADISSPRRRAAGKALRFSVFRRDNFTCRYCGRRAPDVELHLDHVVPFSEGGKTVEENLVAACADCNLGKGSTLLQHA